jgi:hypothetical protein
VTKQVSRETVQNRISDTLSAYTMLEQSKKCFHMRVGFGWVFPVSEEEKTFAVGIKMFYFISHRQPLPEILGQERGA